VTAKPDHLTFDITGMTCASCSARVEKVLSAPVRAFPGPGSTSRSNAPISKACDLDPARVSLTRSAGPDSAPCCAGMIFSAHREADEAQAALRRADERQTLLRLVTSALLTLPIVIGMLPMMTGLGEAWISPGWQAVLATGVMAVSGSRFWREAFGALRGGSANMAVLVSSLGTGAAYLMVDVGSHGRNLERSARGPWRHDGLASSL
jgi:Cu+-exporting ATPase